MQLRRGLSAWIAAELAILSIGVIAQATTQPARELLVYVGTYTTQTSKGIYVSRLNLESGGLSAPELAAESTNPSFLAAHPTAPWLYAVNEVRTFGGTSSGAVSAFAIDRVSGKLTLLNQQPSGGADPAHLVLDRNGRHVLVANYTGGSVAVLPIEGNGWLKPATSVVQHRGSSVNPQRQKEPHAHGIALDRDNRLTYVADLGLDQLLIYRFDAATGSLTAGDPPFATVRPGAGPRHVAMHPDGRFAYVINEMSCTITSFRLDSAGGLRELETVSTLPPGQAVATGYSTAEIVVHPSGRFLYGSNRGHDTLAVFAVDATSGRLSSVEHEPTQGSTPRGFGIDPTGAFLVAGNQRSDSVVVFRIDPKTGQLAPTAQKVQVGSPVSVEFVSR